MRSEPKDRRAPSPPDGAWQATAHHGACAPTNACRPTDGQQAETTCGDAGARQRVALAGPAAMGWDVAGQAQGTPCRAETDNPGQTKPDRQIRAALIHRCRDGRYG